MRKETRPQCPVCRNRYVADDACAYDGNPPCAVALEDEIYRLAEFQGAMAIWAFYREEGPDYYPFWPIWDRRYWLVTEEARIWSAK